MKKLVNEKLGENLFEFKKDLEPVESLGMGLSEKLKQLKTKKDYVRATDFTDDAFIDFLFKGTYVKWINMATSISFDNLVIWEDETDGRTSIVKIKAPGIRETTMLRCEKFSDLIITDIVEFLNSNEIKQNLVDRFNEKNQSINQLGDMIFNECVYKLGLNMSGRYVVTGIAERLIKIYQK